MIKKTLILAITVTISGCNILPPQPQYKVSDSELQRIVFLKKQFTQCLNSDKRIYTHTSKRVTSIMETAIVDKIQKDVIGAEHYSIISRDIPSQIYFSKRHEYFVGQMRNETVPNLHKESCLTLQNFIKAEIKKVENELKEQDKQEKARQAFYATPQGQAYLAQQKLLAQQQAYQQQMLEARRAQQARQEVAEFWSSVNQSIQGVTQSMQNSTNMINQMNYQNSINQMNRSLNNINNNLQRMSPGNQIQWYNVQ